VKLEQIFLFFFILISHNHFSQNNVNLGATNDLINKKINGKVKTLKVITNVITSNQNEPNAFSTVISFFNEKGFIFKEYDNGDSLFTSFDSIGNKIETKTFNNQILTKVLTYNNNLPVFVKGFDHEGKLLWMVETLYDERNNRIKEISYDANNNISSIFEFKFDERGNEIERKKFNSKNKLTLKNIFKYDDANNKTSLVIYDQNNESSILCYEIYSYDDKGQLILTKLYNSANVLESTKKYTYKIEYDEYKNWINNITFVNGIQSSLFQTREIKYF
jgi:hypothetical protein